MPKVEIPFLKRFSSGLTTISDVDSHIRKTLSSLTRNINLAVHEIGDIAEVKKVYTKIEVIKKQENLVGKLLIIY